MFLSRRKFLAASAAPTLAALARPAEAADDYPNKPIHLVVGFVPGAATDYVARIFAEGLSKRLGQNVIVDNRTGAGQLVAMEYVVKAPADGYTLMYGSAGGVTLLPAIKKTMPYQMPDAFTYIGRSVTSAYVILVNAKLPFKTIKEALDWAHENPGKMRFGTSGVGTQADLLRIMMGQEAHTTITHVPYRGGAPALTDTISGQIEMTNQSLMTVKEQVEAGKVRILAYTGATRDPTAPDIPTLAESGYPDIVVQNWHGILGPAKLPVPVQRRLQDALLETQTDPEIKNKLLQLDFDPTPVIGDKFRKEVTDEFEQLKTVAQKANLQID